MNQELANRIAAVRSGLSQIAQRLQYEKDNIARLLSKIEQLEKEKLLLVKAVGLIDRCIQIISANGISKIESIVTGGLHLVFADPQLGLIVEKKEGARGNTYELLMRKGDTIGKPMESFGGGPCNVVGFLLRIILIKRFKLAKFIALDESLINVGKQGGDLSRVSEMLQKLCRDHGFTILAITHEPMLASAADSVYRVSTEDGVPVLRKVDSVEIETQDSGRDLGERSGNDPSLPPPLAQAEPASLP